MTAGETIGCMTLFYETYKSPMLLKILLYFSTIDERYININLRNQSLSLTVYARLSMLDQLYYALEA